MVCCCFTNICSNVFSFEPYPWKPHVSSLALVWTWGTRVETWTLFFAWYATRFFYHEGSPSHHGCFSTKMLEFWMIWGWCRNWNLQKLLYPHFIKIMPYFFGWIPLFLAKPQLQGYPPAHQSESSSAKSSGVRLLGSSGKPLDNPTGLANYRVITHSLFTHQ